MNKYTENSCIIQKHDFKLQDKTKNGAFFRVHHTICETDGELRRLRFVFGAFDNNCNYFACNDHRGNIFIFDFSECKYWILAQSVAGKIIGFAVFQGVSLLLISKEVDNNILFINIKDASIQLEVSGHRTQIKHYSQSSNGSHLMTSSSTEAIIWETRGFTRYFMFMASKEVLVRQISFAPVSDNIVALFQNDRIQIWNNKTLKQIKCLRFKEVKNITCFVFTNNGRVLVVGAMSHIAVIDTESYKIMNCICLCKFNISGNKEIIFLPQPHDGGANRILAILTKQSTVTIIDIEQSSVLKKHSEKDSNVYKVIVSHNGKYLAYIYKLGEIEIYDLTNFFRTNGILTLSNYKVNKCECRKKTDNLKNPTLSKYLYENIEDQINKALDRTRLQKIVQQYGEYPEKYRSIIWKVLMQIPRNIEAYNSLLDRLGHLTREGSWKSINNICKSVYGKQLKRTLLSLLCWCPLFSQISFLPELIFPFVKRLHSDPTLCFEVIITVLINYCQLWFEFSSLPPVNVLGMIENVLSEADGILLDHFCKVGITSHTYAWKMLKSVFSEVFTTSEWLVLWDHILSNEPAFILMAVVSYNMVHRNTLRNFYSFYQFESFYSQQNQINMKGFINNCYILLNNTSSQLHPRQYLKKFSSIKKGLLYPAFNGFPFINVEVKVCH